MKRDYIAIEPILYNDKRYEPDSPITMEEDTAKQLLELGHIKLPNNAAEDATEAEQNTQAERADGVATPEPSKDGSGQAKGKKGK